MEYRALHRRVSVLNEARLERLRAGLGKNRESILDLLPLLFHLNDPLLPGGDTLVPAESGEELPPDPPSGLPLYIPGREAIDAARQIARRNGGQFNTRACRSFELHSLLVTSLATTILHAADHLTLWLVVKEGMERARLDRLLAKGEAILAWLAEEGIDGTLRLIDPARLRSQKPLLQIPDGVEREWPRLLLDELLSEGVVLGGQLPGWWFEAPLGIDQKVEGVDELELFQLGSDPLPPLNQLFRAATEWMFNAVLEPHQWMVRLLHAEHYLQCNANDTLSGLVRETLWAKPDGDPNSYDPWLIRFQRVEQRLEAEGDQLRLDALREAFYLQVGVPLSSRQASRGWRRERLELMTASWGWDSHRFTALDQRNRLRFEVLQETRQRRFMVLGHCFRVWNAVAQQSQQRLSAVIGRFNLLRQYLYTTFERKAGKVELLLSDERQEGAETHLIIDQGEVNALTGEVTQSDGIHTLSRGTVGSGETSQIRRSKSFIDLLAWIHFNRIANDSTRFALLPPEGKVEQRELRGLIEALNQIAPNGRLPPMRPEAYANATRIESGVVFVNTGILDPVTRRNRQGIHLSSDKIDLFSYGSRNESLALTFDLLLITSRREVLVHHYEGETALPDLLCDYLGWFAPGEPPLVLDAICMAPERGPLIARRVSELIAHIAAAIENNRAFRYVVRYMQYYYLVQRDEGEIRLRRAVDYPALCDLLSTPAVSAEPIATSGNPWALATTPLPLILTSQTSGRIQFFCKPQGPLAEIYLLDELGSLFRQVMHFDTVELLLSHHHQFFDAVLARRGECEGPEMIDYYEIFQPTKGRYGLRPIEFSHHPPSRKPISLQVIAESLAEEGKSRLSIFCDDVEFCSSEYGGELFDRVARHILDLRRDSARYPIYITDIDINRLINAVPGDGPIQTIHYLIYKKRIEDRLNESLRRI